MPEVLLQTEVALTKIVEHKALMPKDFKYLEMAAVRINSNVVTAEELQRVREAMGLADADNNPAVGIMENPEGLAKQSLHESVMTNFAPMHETSNPFLKSFQCVDDFMSCGDCRMEYTLDANSILVSNLLEGDILISYKKLPKDSRGDLLIPDNEDFKEAIFHFCMYRYFLAKSVLNEQSSRQERDWHLKRYSVLAHKSKSLNLPSLGKLENMKNAHNRLVPRTNRFESFFSNLSYAENNNI